MRSVGGRFRAANGDRISRRRNEGDRVPPGEGATSIRLPYGKEGKGLEGDVATRGYEALIEPRSPLDARRRMKTDLKEEYLSVGQLAERIPYKPKTIRNLMCQGVFVEGIHFTRLTGRPIFLWSRVQELLREGSHGRASKG